MTYGSKILSMEIDGPTATIIAAAVALVLAAFGFVGRTNTRLGNLETGQKALSDKVDAHHEDNLRMQQQTREEFARLHEQTQAENLRMHEQTREEFARLHEQTQSEIRRVLDALANHSHDADGQVFFRIPPGGEPDS